MNILRSHNGDISPQPRPTTPLPDQSLALRRTTSYASLDTVCPPKRKGIRRRIEEIAENLRPKSTNKKKKSSTTQDVPKNTLQVASDTKSSLEDKEVKRGRRRTPPLRDSPRRSEEASVLAIADRLHSGVPSKDELDAPLTISGGESQSLLDVQLCKEEESGQDCSLPTKTLLPAAHISGKAHGGHRSSTSRADIKSLKLNIQSSATEITIWDGLEAEHHVFKCRLFLQCAVQPYSSVSLPSICKVELDCNTRPAGSHYVRSPVLQATYTGATPGRTTPGKLPTVSLDAGVHMDRVWCKTREDDNAWGWYKDAYIPLSPRLFDKVDYREFTLVSRVWVGESCVEAELTFGISMLLQGVDMK